MAGSEATPTASGPALIGGSSHWQNSPVAAAAEHVLAWIDNSLRYPPRMVDGLPRSHASIHGNALGACTRLGLAGEERTQRLAEAIISWQRPDGGWDCDNRVALQSGSRLADRSR
jgi:hypothetical protein